MGRATRPHLARIVRLHILVAVVNEEQRTAVEPEPIERGENGGEVVHFLHKSRDLVHQNTVAVRQEEAEDTREIFSLELAAAVLVLGDKRLGRVAPYLMG